MKDRYLYKAKRADNGEWVIGSLIALPTGEYEISNKCNNPPDCDPIWDKVVITHKVDPSTICQCTGYEGIYEKDIFQCDDERYVIEWCNYSLYWEAQAIGSPESISLGEFGPDEIVVIGNAIDNPELLKSEKNFCNTTLKTFERKE